MVNQMKNIRIEKITLNVGSGRDQQKLERGVTLVKQITGIEPVKAATTKRIAGWGLRPGLPVGCKLTLRGEKARELLVRFLESKENMLPERSFDNEGNVSFGIPEYIEIPGVEYNPDVGIMGFEVSISLERPGFRVKKRRYKRGAIDKDHGISKEEAMEFMKESFNIAIGETHDV